MHAVRYTTVAVVAAWSLCATISVIGAVIHVPGDFQGVQQAVDAAVDGDVVLLAKGVHRGGIDLRGKAIMLRGEMGAEFTALLGGDAVIRCTSGEGLDTVIEGLTIAGGIGLAGKDALTRGGGLFFREASPIVRLCMVVGNAADIGPGAWIDRGAPTFHDCWFHDNVAGVGPGVQIHRAAPRFIRCGFHEEAVGWTDAPVVSIRPDCDEPGGACCLGSSCVETTPEACGAVGGRWHEHVPCAADACPPQCPGDSNGDRRVNHTDLLAVLDQWGMCR